MSVSKATTVILLGQPWDSVLSRLSTELVGRGVEVIFLRDLYNIPLSLPHGNNLVRPKIVQNDRTIFLDEEGVVLLYSHLHLGQSEFVLSRDDLEYTNLEIRSAWTALLNLTPCRVINRPLGQYPLFSPSNWHSRRLAEMYGIEALHDHISDGEKILTNYSDSNDFIVQDISNLRVLLPHQRQKINPSNYYLVIEVPNDIPYAICACIGSEMIDFSFRQPSIYDKLDSSVSSSARSNSERLKQILGLDYVYFVFANIEGQLKFSFYQTFPPFVFSLQILNEIKDTLTRFILEN